MMSPLDATFDFARQSKECLSVPVLSREFQSTLSHFGVTASSAWALVSADPKVEKGFGEWPEKWAKFYNKQQYFGMDPVLKALIQGMGPGYWDEQVAKVEKTDGADQVMAEARNFGYADGYSQIVATPQGAVYLVSLYGDKLDRDPNAREMFDLMSYKFVQEGAKLLGRSQGLRPELVKLTPRQLEVLTEKSKGLTDVEAAVEIGVSLKAVEGHLGNIRKSLGVKRTSDAIELAKETGLIKRPAILLSSKIDA